MQAQHNLTSLYVQIFVVLRTHFAQIVMLGSVLLLATLMIILELHLVGDAHVTSSIGRQIAEGSPDIIAVPRTAAVQG